MKAAAYPLLMLAGIIGGGIFWSRLARRDERLVLIYAAALGGAFAGAKLAYLAAEGWLHIGQPGMWLQLATGKSILGALLGGYAAVELAKKYSGYTQATGDWFATIVPLSVALGRVGCLLHGCCLGIVCPPAWYTIRDPFGDSRWPAVPVEMGFNLLCAALFWQLRRRRILPGQHFHLYLMAYGLFRFGHEFLRDTPRLLWGMTGYQAIAAACFALGLTGFIRRRRAPEPAEEKSARLPATAAAAREPAAGIA
jgi:phosphatidylglycerol:prolipoprotein diacylglycerol transferase